ncbi:MAG: sulfate adenylyltransferase [Hyphomicrobiaceae bacterium]|nr:MAG: sulfate adenylyltransferase [Hyphomicrobiaceae bacterium]
MSKLVPPHGGRGLKPLLVPRDRLQAELSNARRLPRVKVSSQAASDLFMFAMGAYTPLDGFMGYEDWLRCATEMRLKDGTFWPIPITLQLDKDGGSRIVVGEEIVLVEGETDEPLAIMRVTSLSSVDLDIEAKNVFRTLDPKHPGVAKLLAAGSNIVGGPLRILSEGGYPARYPDLYVRPAQARQMFEERGWSRVAAFQTRNPMHRSHEHLVKIAVEVTDGVFIHQVLGKLKEGDIPAEVRTRAIAAMIDNYFRPNTVIQAGYPIEMRYAGPREALLHAVIRQNFGCSHLIVGRDHAGVGSYYGPYDAQKIFDELWQGALLTRPLKIDVTFYCRKCYGMATAKTCPHPASEQIQVSGTEQRRMLAGGEAIPPEFSRPEVVAILREYYRGLPAKN